MILTLLYEINRLAVCIYFVTFYDKIETIGQAIFFLMIWEKIALRRAYILSQNVTK